MRGDLWAHLPRCAECLAIFDQKWHDPHAPPSLFTQSCLEQHFFLFSRMKKVLKEKHIADVEEVKPKTAEALKGIKTNEFKTCFEQWEKMSQQVYWIRWRGLWRWLKFKHVRTNTQFFIKKFHVGFLGGPPRRWRQRQAGYSLPKEQQPVVCISQQTRKCGLFLQLLLTLQELYLVCDSQYSSKVLPCYHHAPGLHTTCLNANQVGSLVHLSLGSTHSKEKKNCGG